MRKVKGYVFIAECDYVNLLIGKRTDSEIDIDAESLESNGVVPYNSLEEARNGSIEFKEKRTGVKSVRLGKLEMEIAETIEELEYFEEKESLITIMKYDDRWLNFIGQHVEGKPSIYPLFGANMSENGFQPFNYGRKLWTAYKKAEYALTEVNRQGELPATIATFNLEIIQ